MTAEFSASLLQSSVSHDPSEIILISTVQETFPIIINFENCIIVLHFFLETKTHLFQDSIYLK